ncbi:VOC family protein [Streptomyces monomycini]|uniref:VOC family protein n=1 Tax=Streptomyces monomycini TaxID=371720 RepID=UPI00067A9ED2|nr:VOC family protein [Streptomyces monomycini]
MADIRHTTAGDTSQRPGAPARFKDLALDARDHHALADWWCEVMGYVRRPAAAGEEQPRARPVPIVDPAGRGPLIWINPVTELKTVKNRMHLDVWGDTGRLLRLGATLVRKRDEDIAWDVLADPEGNEFCVFAPPEATTGPGEGS